MRSENQVGDKSSGAGQIKGKIGHYFGRIRESIKSRKARNQERRLNFPLLDIALKHRILALLSYLGVLVIIPLIFGRKIAFIQYHARQGVALLGLWVIGIFSFYVPFLPWAIVFIILVETLIGLVNVITHREKHLPIIGRVALT